MATSGTTAFNLEISEVIEEAFERCGLQSKTGYDIETARRSLNLMSLEWANRGLNFWCVEEGTASTVAGTSSYTLPADTIDLIKYWLDLIFDLISCILFRYFYFCLFCILGPVGFNR